jgi:pimeloyl-ACP methyl ester carboxylesterase
MHLMLLPGMDGTGKLFEPLLQALPATLNPVVVAYPGDRPCSYAELLPLVEAAIPAGSEFLVLGESFSGPLALMLASRQPPGLRGVVLCASFARCPLPFFARWFRGLIWPLWFRLAPVWMARRVLLGRHATPALGQILEAALAGVQPAVLASRARMILAVDVGVELQACSVPLLYLAATEDRLVSPRSLAHIRRLCPKVEAETLVGPHLLLQAAPQEAARAIQRFAVGCGAPA